MSKTRSKDESVTLTKLPVIVEPSMVYCRSDGKQCQYRGVPLDRTVPWCQYAYKHIEPLSERWKAPDWCPLATNALIGLPAKQIPVHYAYAEEFEVNITWKAKGRE